MTRHIHFLQTFAKVTLVIFGFSTVVFLLVAGVISSIPQERIVVQDMGQAGLPAWVVHHPRFFTSACLAYSVLALLASVGLKRLKQWAYRAWILLFAVALVWTVAVLVSTLLQVTTSEAPSPGIFPSDSVLAALAVLPPALIALVVLPLLLKRFLKARASVR